jgi:hypothetical protein
MPLSLCEYSGERSSALFLLLISIKIWSDQGSNAAHSTISHFGSLARISHQVSTAVADPGMSTALRSVDMLSSMPAGPSVVLAEMRQMRLVSMPVCAASLRNLVRNAV